MTRSFFPTIGKAAVRSILLLFSGIITYLAFPGGSWPFLGWVCMVPWLAAASGAGRGCGFFYGTIYGFLWAVPGQLNGIYSAVATLEVTAALQTVIIILFFGSYILPFAVFGFFQGCIKRNGLWQAIWRSAVFTAIICWSPAVFPVYPVHLLHDQTLLLQAADIGGVPFLQFIHILINILAADALVGLWQKRFWVSPLVFLTSIICCVAAYGTWRVHEFQGQVERGEGKEIQIISIQPNIPSKGNMNALIRDNRTRVASSLELTRRMVAGHPKADLVVWPETPVEAPCDQDSKVFKRLSAFAVQENLPVLYQCEAGYDDVNGKQYYNMVQLVQADGSPGPAYSKRGLIPVFEYNILNDRPEFLGGLVTKPGSFVPGKCAVVFEISPGRVVIPVICYEVHYPRFIRDGVRQGGNVIVNIANDRIFGKSRICFLDYAMAKFRSVEFRLPMVRVTNSGPGAFIKATGETVKGSLTKPFRSATTSFPLFIPYRGSVYYLIGDIFLYIITALAVLSTLFHITIKLKKARSRGVGPLNSGPDLL